MRLFAARLCALVANPTNALANMSGEGRILIRDYAPTSTRAFLFFYSTWAVVWVTFFYHWKLYLDIYILV